MKILIIGFLLFNITYCFYGCSNEDISIKNNSTFSDMGESNLQFKNWNDINPEDKQKFTEEYNSEKEKRVIYGKYYDSFGPVAILDFLENKYEVCHSQSHELGKLIYSDLQDIKLALQLCKNRCTNGCMHGVVSEAFSGMNDEEILDKIKNFCKSDSINEIHKEGNCAHAIGHSLMIVNGYSIEKSLLGCKKFKKTGMDYYCATGVYMEYENKLSISNDLGLCGPVNRKSLHYPCDTYSHFLPACYRYITPLIAIDLGGKMEYTVKECLKLDQKSKRACFHGIGALYAGSVGAITKDLLKKTCLKGDEIDQIMCIEGMIEKMADYDQDYALNVCNYFDGKNKDVCKSAAKERMYRLDKSTLKYYLE